MTYDQRFTDRLDFAMGILTFVGAAIAILFPFALIFVNMFFNVPHFNAILIICLITGATLMAIGFGYFVCRKEL